MSSSPKTLFLFLQKFQLTPFSMAFIYIVFALIWIFGSNYLLTIHVNDPVLAQQLEVLKGVFFVAITGGLFYWLLKNWHARILSTQNQLQETLDAIPDLLFELDLNGRYYTYHSPHTDLLAAPPEVLIGKTVHDILPLEAADICLSALQEANEKGVSHGQQIELLLPQGKRWFELSISRKQLQHHETPHFIVISRDITERKEVETTNQRLTQLYNALSQCNQAIVRCSNESELFKQICQDAVMFGGMEMVWIGLYDEQSHHIKPISYYGKGTDYLQNLEISVDAQDPRGQGPSAIVFREDRPFWCQDFQNDPATAFWHDHGKLFGWKASAAVPIHRNGIVIGTFNLYANHKNAFDDIAKKLLIEMMGDVDYALDNFEREIRRKKTEMELLKRTQAMEQSPNSIIITDFKANIEYVNTAFINNTGYTLSEVIGKNPRLLKSGKTPEHAYDDMWATLVRGEKWQGEFINQRKDGSHYVYSINVAPVIDSDGQTTHYVAIEEDISEQKRTQEHIHYLANYDTLTGLPNRIQMDDHLNYTLTLAKRNNGHFAVMFLDLDHFKDINDTLGHSIGDILLIQLAKRLTSVLRDEDTVSRMGGDEFIVLLPDTDTNGAAQVAQKLLASIAQPFSIEEHQLSVTASIGLSFYPNDGSNIEILSKNADAAMYRAKQQGRNSYCFFTEEMQVNSQRNLLLSNALHTALEQNELYLMYQPQLSTENGTVIGAEALLRWEHPKLGTISPAEFIPIAEDNGTILSIGEWVLRTAIQQAKNWMQLGHLPLIMAVNISAIQFRHPNLPDLITNILQEIGLPPEYLEIELTEGIAMNNPHIAINTMNNLHERGIRMSIDDFGTGYSSLSYLKKFNVYKLKIDQSFVRDISTDPEDKAIVSAVIHMAHSLGLQTIAEGVETIEQLAYLREQGCDEIQGYYFSKPLRSEQFEAYLKQNEQNRANH
ncbi:MAG TPA: EAL domain-containing protein [Sulfuricurvum sp.]|nr:EAL domain-containing protein [Sulfuricurvum sp.]